MGSIVRAVVVQRQREAREQQQLTFISGRISQRGREETTESENQLTANTNTCMHGQTENNKTEHLLHQ